MKKGLVALLKGTFLVSGHAPKNWLFIVFASLLATIMIASSHSADRKVHEIAALNVEADGNQRLLIFNAPTPAQGEVGGPIAYDMSFGNANQDSRIIGITGIRR